MDKLVVVCMHRATAETPLLDERREFRDFLPLAEALVATRAGAPE